MKKKIPDFIARPLGGSLFKRLVLLNLPHLGLVPRIVCLCSFAAAVLVTAVTMKLDVEKQGNYREFEVGKVADRDIVAEYSISYIDVEATRRRMEAQENLVPAVFRYSAGISHEAIASWNAFCDFADTAAADEVSPASMRLTVQAEYPAYFPAEVLFAYFNNPDRAQFRGWGIEVLNRVFQKGIFALNDADMERHNPDMVEKLIAQGDRIERERIDLGNIVSLRHVGEAITQTAESAGLPPEFSALAPLLLRPFVHENVFFSQEDTELRIAEAMERVVAVTKNIEKGKRIIRKGFVITAEAMQELQALNAALPKRDPRSVIGLILLLGLLYILFVLLQGKLVLPRNISGRESCLLFVLVCLYLAGAGIAKNMVPIESIYPVSVFFPTALMVMIPAVFFGPLFALVMALTFPLGACFAGFFDIYSYIFALISGIAASLVLKDAEKRMDLVKAGLAIAAANCLAVIVILLMRAADFSAYPMMLFCAAFNGIVSGMLILGVLPPLEYILNATTRFRLIELSDLNAPILRKLFTAAPGTYSHSIMVANLAEQACQDIGANALLARVGAYYHDIGKMDNPDYFVENQTDYNRHDAIAPRLSATVIRSHVKLGIEKARNLGLPPDVVNIIAEHHGNSLIMWFYKKAIQQEDQVNSDDFSYPGVPPRSRESAIVMLADVTEAAVRTLVKPTVAKMEKFIQQLIDGKVEHGQLAQSDLTFRDLETIKNAFVRVLAGYYHSRIEYPKNDGEDSK
ncbi:MAG: HDIG domain-containing protein [Treponema sp.]|nr:HDIG domain-containing protein [Treponema sp.]